MLKIEAINDVVIVHKDPSVSNSPLILPNPQPKSINDIPEPYTGTIDSVGEENMWREGDRIAFDGYAGGIYMKIDEDEYVVISPEMIVGKLW